MVNLKWYHIQELEEQIMDDENKIVIYVKNGLVKDTRKFTCKHELVIADEVLPV